MHFQYESKIPLAYEGDDYPTELPIRLDTVALKVEDSNVFSLTNPGTRGAWQSMHAFPRAYGFVQLGPKSAYSPSLTSLVTSCVLRVERKFGVSMFHQFHCR